MCNKFKFDCSCHSMWKQQKISILTPHISKLVFITTRPICSVHQFHHNGVIKTTNTTYLFVITFRRRANQTIVNATYNLWFGLFRASHTFTFINSCFRCDYLLKLQHFFPVIRAHGKIFPIEKTATKIMYGLNNKRK